MSELTIWINGKPKVFNLDQPNPPSEAQVAEIKGLFLRENPNWGVGKSAPAGNTGRVGYQGSRISGTLPGGSIGGDPNNFTPVDPFGTTVKDDATKQPVSPERIKHDRNVAILNQQAAMGDVVAQTKLLQLQGARPQRNEVKALATKLTTPTIPQPKPVAKPAVDIRANPVRDTIQKAVKEVTEKTKGRPIRQGHFNDPELRGVHWAQYGPGYQADVDGTIVKAPNRNELMVRAKQVRAQALAQKQTVLQSPNVSAYIESNPKARPENLTPDTSLFLHNVSDRQQKEAFNKRVSEIPGDILKLVGIDPQIAEAAKTLGPGPGHAADLITGLITSGSQIGQELRTLKSDEFTPDEKWGALGNIAVAALTAELPVKGSESVIGKILGEGIPWVKKLFTLDDAAFSKALSGIGDAEKAAAIQKLRDKWLTSEGNPKFDIRGVKSPEGSIKVEPAIETASKPAEKIVRAPVETIDARIKAKQTEIDNLQKTKASSERVAKLHDEMDQLIQERLGPKQVTPPGVEPKAEKPQPKPNIAPHAPESSKGKTTGLANQTEFRMSEEGRIEPVQPGVGRKFGTAQAEGKLAVESGEIKPYELADELENSPRPISHKEVGALLEGARRLENEVNRISDSLKSLKGRAFEEAHDQLAKARETFNDFLRKAQKGKTELSDAFRALQEGSDLDTGSLAQVIQRRAKNMGLDDLPTNSEEYKKLAKEVEELHAEVKSIVPDFDPSKETVAEAMRRRLSQVSDADRAKAEVVLRQSSTPRVNRRDPAVLRKTRADATSRLSARVAKIGGQLSAGPGQALSALREAAPEIIDDIKIIIKTLAEEFKITRLDKNLFDRVRKEIPDIDLTDDDIVKTLAGVWDERAAKQPTFYERLTKQARGKELEGYKDAQSRLKGAEKRMKEWEAKPNQLDQAEVKANRARLNKAKERMREWEARESKAKSKEEREAIRGDQKRLKAIEKDLRLTEGRLDKLDDLNEQIESGGIWESVPKINKLSNAQQKLDLKIQLKQDKIKRMVNERDMSKFEKGVRFATSTGRAVLGSDLGVLARQGMRAWTKPLIAIKNTKNALKAMMSDENLLHFQNERMTREIDGKLAEPIRRKAHLSRTTHFADQEEFALGKLFRWFGDIGGHAPGKVGEVLKELPGALDRFQSEFINGVRDDFFDYGIKRGWSAAELDDRAKYINSVFGRSNAKQVGTLAEVLLTSPRYERSRWETLYRMVRDPLKAGVSLGKDKAANEAVKEMAIMAGEVLAVVKLAELAGFDTPLNPMDKEFGIMRRGNETWDISAGLGPRFRDLMKLLKLGDPKNRETIGSISGRATTRAISPGVRIPTQQAYFTKQRAQGVKEADIKDPFSGFEPDPGDKGIQSLAFLIWKQTNQAIQEQGILNGLGVFAKEFVGTSVNRYPSRKVDAAGRPYNESQVKADKKYLDEMERVGVVGKLADKDSGQTDEYQMRISKEAGNKVMEIVKPVIDSPVYKQLTRTQKGDLLKARITQAKKLYHAPPNQREAEYKRKKHSEQIQRETKAGIK